MAHTDLTQQAPLAEGFYTSEIPSLDRWPIRTFLPVGYEPNYAYPLLVFFHAHRSSEEEILRLAPRLSRRNYVCIGLRGPESLGSRPDGKAAFGWGDDGRWDTPLEEYVFRAVEQTRRHYHVHSERVYLVGFREGATLAYRLGLTFPDRFAGVVALNGQLPRHNRPLFRFPDVRSLKVLIGHSENSPDVELARADYMLLWSAGLPVKMRVYSTGQRLHPEMLRDVDRWLIGNVNDENWAS